MMACGYGAAFGAIQQMPRIVPGLPEVRGAARGRRSEQTVSAVQSFQEFGGLAGRILLAFLAVRIVSRRRLLRVFQIPGLILLPIVFLVSRRRAASTLLKWGIFLRRAADHRAVQLLGQLPAARLSRRTCAAPARASPPTSAAA